MRASETRCGNHIAYLDQEIKSLKEQIAAHIQDDPDLRTKRDLLKSIPGIGEATIAAILGGTRICLRGVIGSKRSLHT